MWCPPATDATSPLVPQNPDYHGFHDDPVVDLWNMRIVFFFSVSVCIVIGFTLMHYMPDNGLAGLGGEGTQDIWVIWERSGS